MGHTHFERLQEDMENFAFPINFWSNGTQWQHLSKQIHCNLAMQNVLIRVGHIRRFVHVAPQNPLMANPVKVCYSTFLFEGP